MFKKNSEDSLKRQALYTVIKIVISILMMLLAVLMMKINTDSKVVNFIVLLLLLFTMIPAFGLPIYSFVLAFCILIRGILNPKQSFDEYGKEILERCFGWHEPEVGPLPRIAMKIPFLGRKVEKIVEAKSTNSAKDYFFHIVLYLILIFASWNIMTQLMLPIIIQYTTGETKIELLKNYIVYLYEVIMS